MGQVIRYKNISITIRSDDHEPPHIHAIGPGAEAKIEILTGTVVWSYGFSRKALDEILQLVLSRQFELMEKWYEIHGENEE